MLPPLEFGHWQSNPAQYPRRTVQGRRKNGCGQAPARQHLHRRGQLQQLREGRAQTLVGRQDLAQEAHLHLCEKMAQCPNSSETDGALGSHLII